MTLPSRVERLRSYIAFFPKMVEKCLTVAFSDVAPTIMDLMGIPQPEEMTGKSLIEGD